MSALPAPDVAIHILRSRRFRTHWNKAHQGTDPQGDMLSQEIESLKHGNSLQQHNAFIASLLDTSIKALSNSKAPEDIALKRSFQIVRQEISEEKTPQRKKSALPPLTPVQKEIIKSFEEHTGLNSINPPKEVYAMMKAATKHIWEDIKKDPREAIGFLALGVGLWQFMDAKFSKTVYFDPKILTATDIPATEAYADADLDTLEALLNSDAPLKVSDQFDLTRLDQINTNMDIACHSDTAFSPEHCGRINTLVSDAQSWLSSAKETLYDDRYAALLKESTLNLGEALSLQGAFSQAFVKGAEYASMLWTDYDFVENFIHFALLTASFRIAKKLRSMESDELNELKGNILDAAHKAKDRYLPYIFAGVAGAGAGVHSGEFSAIVWTSLAGAIAGRYVQKKWIKHSNATKFTRSVMSGMRKRLIDSTSASSFKPSSSRWYSAVNRTTILATTTALAAASADYAFNEGQASGAALGAALATAKFWFANAVQEVGLHAIFAGSGAASGVAYADTKAYLRKKGNGLFGKKSRKDDKLSQRSHHGNELTPAAQSAYTPG